jgi:hypothetical protein
MNPATDAIATATTPRATAALRDRCPGGGSSVPAGAGASQAVQRRPVTTASHRGQRITCSTTGSTSLVADDPVQRSPFTTFAG